MIYADTLTCHVTPNSVDPTSLSCSVPPLEWLDLWTMFGAWATAGVTGLLAYHAWKAWRNSQAQIETMKGQIRSSENTARTEQLEREATFQVETLAPYLAAWTAVRHRIQFGKWTEACPSASDIRSAGASWRLRHHRSHSELSLSQAKYEDQIINEISIFLINTSPGIKLSGVPQFIEEVITDLIESLTSYQLEPDRRIEFHELWKFQTIDLSNENYISTFYEKANS